MGEVTEKIYCCDRGDNDNALAVAILAGNNRKDDWSTISPYTPKHTRGRLLMLVCRRHSQIKQMYHWQKQNNIWNL